MAFQKSVPLFENKKVFFPNRTRFAGILGLRSGPKKVQKTVIFAKKHHFWVPFKKGVKKWLSLILKLATKFWTKKWCFFAHPKKKTPIFGKTDFFVLIIFDHFCKNVERAHQNIGSGQKRVKKGVQKGVKKGSKKGHF